MNKIQTNVSGDCSIVRRFGNPKLPY